MKTSTSASELSVPTSLASATNHIKFIKVITRDQIAEIGKFHKTHALKGELNAVLDIDSDFLTEERPLIVEIDGIFVPFYAESIRPKGEHSSLVKLQGIDSEEEARCFVNKLIYARLSDISEFEAELGEEDGEEGEEGAYADAFIGYTMLNLTEAGEEKLGIIDDIDAESMNPLFIVVTEAGGRLLIPIADEFIAGIDPENRTITVTLPEGLIDMQT